MTPPDRLRLQLGPFCSKRDSAISAQLKKTMTMTAKEKKTESELIQLLMDGVRLRAECEHVIGVAIIRPTTKNWDAAWKVDGNEIACRHAFALADELQSKFDLA